MNNTGINDIERLCHLNNDTSGNAYDIVTKFSLTDKNFGLGWRADYQTSSSLKCLE